MLMVFDHSARFLLHWTGYNPVNLKELECQT